MPRDIQWLFIRLRFFHPDTWDLVTIQWVLRRLRYHDDEDDESDAARTFGMYPDADNQILCALMIPDSLEPHVVVFTRNAVLSTGSTLEFSAHYYLKDPDWHTTYAKTFSGGIVTESWPAVTGGQTKYFNTLFDAAADARK
jgi:hypothetical protein